MPRIRRVCVTVDEGVRCELRLDAHRHREAAAAASNLLLAATMLGACVGAAKSDGELAWRATTAHALAVGLTLGLGHLVKESVARPRPFERDLAPDAPRARTASFYSLHSAIAFASAGFACASPPRGSRTACMVTNGTALALAGATGALRVFSDRHYLTDVVAGAAIGLAAGVLLPLAMLRRD